MTASICLVSGDGLGVKVEGMYAKGTKPKWWPCFLLFLNVFDCTGV
jgi:hypothetical protein